MFGQWVIFVEYKEYKEKHQNDEQIYQNNA